MIEAVFLDFYGTLATFHPPREELQAAACAHFGITLNVKGIDKGYAAADALMARENALLPLRKRNQQARDDFFAEYEQLILQAAGANVSKAKAGEVWQHIRQMKYDLALFDDVLPALHMLKEQGLTLGVISNITRDMKQLMESLGIALYIDFAVTSTEAGAEKPHAPIFLAALSKAGVEPGDALHVGDQVDSDVEGARAVGINPVLIDRYGSHADYQGCPRIQSLMELPALLAEHVEDDLPQE